MPDRSYLDRKRPSVFHRAFESGQDAEGFKAPVNAKEPADLVKLQSLFQSSFLTQTLDSKQHMILA